MRKKQIRFAAILCILCLSLGSSRVYAQEPDLALQQEAQAADSVEPMEAIEILDSIKQLAAGTVLEENAIDKKHLRRYFTSEKIGKKSEVYKRIVGKSFDPDGMVKRKELRYLKVLHYNYKHRIQVGELIVHKAIAKDILTIFRKLFEKEYEIKSMYLIDEYWEGNPEDSDTASCEAGNTSAFCYRTMTDGKKLSNHAYGLAIDINTRENPYVRYQGEKAICYHKNAKKFINRKGGNEHMIDHADYCYKLFQKYGFTWGGDWNNPKDYQHFEKKIKI